MLVFDTPPNSLENYPISESSAVISAIAKMIQMLRPTVVMLQLKFKVQIRLSVHFVEKDCYFSELKHKNWYAVVIVLYHKCMKMSAFIQKRENRNYFSVKRQHWLDFSPIDGDIV